MKKSESHIIDEKAIHYFKGRLQGDQWIVYDITPDYGKDHKVEIAKEGRLTGLYIWAQIKGTSRPKTTNRNTITFDVETKDLIYWLKLRAPVFLIVVDVSKNAAYWLFVQEHVESCLSHKDWRQQNRVRVHLDTRNNLENLDSFREAAHRALGYIARANLAVGISFAEESFKWLDPRFDVRVSATAHGETINLNATEPISVNFEFGPSFVESNKPMELLGKGMPVEINPGDITVEGSPLIRSMVEKTAENRGQLHICSHSKGHIRLVHLDQTGQEIGRSHEIEASFEGGLEEIRFSATSRYKVLSITGNIQQHSEAATRLNLSYNFQAWRARPLNLLPDFELVKEVLGNLENNHQTKVEFFDKGYHASTGHVTWRQVELKALQQVHGFLEFISQARWIAHKLRLTTALPSNLSPNQVEEVERLYCLLTESRFRCNGASRVVTGHSAASGIEQLLNQLESHTNPFRLELYSDAPWPFLGLSVNIGSVKSQLSHMLPTFDREQLARQIQEGIPEISLGWQGTSASEWVMERIDEQLMSSHEQDMNDQAQ